MPDRILAMAAVASLLFAGCGTDYKKEVSFVTGSVRCNGKPLTEGQVLFTPIVPAGADPLKSGKSASGYIQPDGTYTLTTYEEGDGAVIGLHEVRVLIIPPEDDEQYVPSQFACGETVLQKEVGEDDNVIDIELTTRRNARR